MTKIGNALKIALRIIFLPLMVLLAILSLTLRGLTAVLLLIDRFVLDYMKWIDDTLPRPRKPTKRAS